MLVCGCCHEALDQLNDFAKLRSVVVFKRCGTLFHEECIVKDFENQGVYFDEAAEVGSARSDLPESECPCCPVCKASARECEDGFCRDDIEINEFGFRCFDVIETIARQNIAPELPIIVRAVEQTALANPVPPEAGDDGILPSSSFKINYEVAADTRAILDLAEIASKVKTDVDALAEKLREKFDFLTENGEEMHEQDGQGGNAWMLYLTGATAKVEELKTAIEAVVVQSKAEHSQEVCKEHVSALERSICTLIKHADFLGQMRQSIIDYRTNLTKPCVRHEAAMISTKADYDLNIRKAEIRTDRAEQRLKRAYEEAEEKSLEISGMRGEIDGLKQERDELKRKLGKMARSQALAATLHTPPSRTANVENKLFDLENAVKELERKAATPASPRSVTYAHPPDRLTGTSQSQGLVTSTPYRSSSSLDASLDTSRSRSKRLSDRDSPAEAEEVSKETTRPSKRMRTSVTSEDLADLLPATDPASSASTTAYRPLFED